MTTHHHEADTDAIIDEHPHPMSSTFHDDQPDQEGERYKAVEKIGNGAYGVVFKCKDTQRDNRFV